MRPFLNLGSFLAFALLAPLPAGAAPSPRDTLVVSSAWLAQRLKDPALVLLHVGDKAEYEAAHLPGARFVALDDISISDHTGSGNGLMLEMPPLETLRHKLASLGISDNSRIVVYFGKDWISPATRVIFTLDYVGLGDRTSLLDGGQPAWVREGQAVTSVVVEPARGSLSALRARPIVVTRDYVRQNLAAPRQAIIDGRTASFYDGAQSGGGRTRPHRAGHIQGAFSFPFTETTDERLMLRSPSELQARFEKAGLKPGDTILGYCHLGQQATAMLFAARTLGYQVLLYDGSFEDWTRFPDHPVVNPAAAAPTRDAR